MMIMQWCKLAEFSITANYLKHLFTEMAFYSIETAWYSKDRPRSELHKL